ncbi:MAG: alkaline phosphatase [Chloroflexi bacterium]|nr:alkaline phosphatase [Chloroflexota bacterium]
MNSPRQKPVLAAACIFPLILIILITGCTGSGLPQAAPPFTASPSPTATPARTRTPSPTASSTPSPSPTATPTITLTPTPAPAVILAAGDIALCGLDYDEQTAAILQRYPEAAVLAVGDTVQDSGRAVEYQNCFEPSWGRFKERIYPVPGNHDYMTESASPYYTYFGSLAGEPGAGYYAFDLNGWHIIGLNSNCNDIACGNESRQVEWLRQELQARAGGCTLLFFHHPRFSSGLAGNYGSVSRFWRVAYENGADVILSAHDHHYERFAPQDPDGNADPQNGIRQFVVGTGGAPLRALGETKPNSEIRDNSTHGVLKLELYPGSYTWTFLPVEGGTFTDSGTTQCH